MTIPLHWHRSDNFGDALAPWLVRRITRDEPIYVHPRAGPVPYVLTGSILHHNKSRGIVWGAGAAFEDDLDPSRLSHPSEEYRILATRGPLSKARVEEAGHRPQTCGDPALLLARLYRPNPRLPSSVGIICSWVDYDKVAATYGSKIPVLNASCPVEEVIDTIASWDLVVSSCLHGLAAAVAYGKPVVWAKFSDLMIGDGFKFRDFFAFFDAELQPAYRPDPAAFEKDARVFTLPDLEPLQACCPLPAADLENCHAHPDSHPSRRGTDHDRRRRHHRGRRNPPKRCPDPSDRTS